VRKFLSLSLGPDVDLNLVGALFIFASAAIPIYLSFKVHGISRKLTIILSTFILVCGLFWVSIILGLVVLGQELLSPLSALILAYFGLTYLSVVRDKSAVKNHP
jgi:hypothetical protein